MKYKLCPSNFKFVLLFFLIITACGKSDDSDNVTEQMEVIIDDFDDNSKDEIDWENARLVWDEEFDEPNLADGEWNYVNNSNNAEVADQWQIYQKENVVVNAGNLRIEANKTGVGQKKGDYTSAKLNNTTAFQYGRIEIMAKLPEGEKNGIWAKLSLVGANESQVGWPKCGEINIMEYLSYRPNETYITVHSNANNSAKGTVVISYNDIESAEEEFHAYGLLWTKEYLKFYVDHIDNVTYTFNRPTNPTVDNWPFDQPFFFKTDLVVGGKYGGAEGVDDTLFPAAMEIKYIRIYHGK